MKIIEWHVADAYKPMPASRLIPADTQEFEHDGFFFAYSPKTGRFFALKDAKWVMLTLWTEDGEAVGFKLWGRRTSQRLSPLNLIGQYFLNGGKPLPKGVEVRTHSRYGDRASRSRTHNLRLHESLDCVTGQP